ncbi:glycosyltransferase [Aequorivita flava]|uniref:Glycosyltransferase n=1 Tax=Aequorivita flava TaxID=3114371 RepID=A0AB35YYJ3_9FLAO
MIKKGNIVILTASHPYKAAGLVAFDLMHSLEMANYNVQIITNARLEKNYEQTFSLRGVSRMIFTHRILKSLRIRFNRLFKITRFKTDPNYHMNGLNPMKGIMLSKKIAKNLPSKVDAFIYLFPQNFLDTTGLNYLNKITKAPIFWYMMDMAPMTGGCHYAWNCLGYTAKCGMCPGIYSNDKSDITNQLWQEKKKYIESANIIPIAASQGQYNQLKSSSLFTDKNKYKVLIPIDSNIFKPNNKHDARNKIGLPLDKKIIFFGAASINESRKGLKELIESLKLLKSEMILEDSTVFVAVAGNRNQQLENEIPFAHKFLGYLNYKQLATAYQAADLFACPSIEDSGPMMINQSIMCGTPVVSFNIGVSLDLVINYKTGFKVANGDTLEFAKALNLILTLPTNELENMSFYCRNLGLEKTSMESICKLWKRILEYEISNQ